MTRKLESRIEIKAGDFIGFSGRDLMSAVINVGTLGIPFFGLSHCGIAVSDPETPDNLMIFESTTISPGPCAFTRERTSGVQAHRLPWRIENYEGKVWHYPLSRTLSEAQRGVLWRSCLDDLGKDYDYLQAFRSRSLGFGWLEKALYGKENLTSVYCSEFVASKYRELDVFRTGNVSRWSPNRLSRSLIERQTVAGYWRIA